MSWIQKVCSTAAVLVISGLATPTIADEPAAVETETFNPAPGGERKSPAGEASISARLTVKQPGAAAASDSQGTYDPSADPSAPKIGEGEQSASSELQEN